MGKWLASSRSCSSIEESDKHHGVWVEEKRKRSERCSPQFCLDKLTPFKSVGRSYDGLSETTHDEAGELLRIYYQTAEGEEQ
jgi:hypothetical protein